MYSINSLPIIDSTRSILSFFIYLFFDLKLNFHPDTPFYDYYEKDQQSFTGIEVELLEKKLQECFDFCGDTIDLYEIAVQAFDFYNFISNKNIITDSAAIIEYHSNFTNVEDHSDPPLSVHVYGNVHYMDEVLPGHFALYDYDSEKREKRGSLREMEIILYEWYLKNYKPNWAVYQAASQMCDDWGRSEGLEEEEMQARALAFCEKNNIFISLDEWVAGEGKYWNP